jgi:NitT/TauT family transport system substrate-binding protein
MRATMIRAIALALVFALPVLAGSSATAQTLTKLRVAAFPIDVSALSYFAAQQGFFKKHGLDVEIVTLANGPAVAAAVIGGSLDIGAGNTSTIAIAHERGVGFLLVAPSGAYSYKAPTSALMVRKDGPVKTPADMAGKTVAVGGLRTISEIGVRAWADKNGLKPDAIKYVEVPFPQLASAVESGRVDAVMVEEPTMGTLLAGNGRAIGDPYGTIAPQWIEGGYFCSADFAKAHPDVIKQFADAMAEAAVWANANHAATAAMLETYTKGPVSPAMVRIAFPERLRSSDLQPLIDASVKFGVLKATFPARDLFAPGIGAQ